MQTITSQGGYLYGPRGVNIDPSGDILVSDHTDPGVNLVIRIDPVTGEQMLITKSIPAGGVQWAITVMPLPTEQKMH